MPAYVKVPRNEAVLRSFGPYPRLIDFGTGDTEVQRHARDKGLSSVEPSTQATLLSLVEQSRSRPVNFFDIGAHVGFHSLIVSSVYPADRVHVAAFEPTPHTAAVARTLAAANRRPIRIERCAISDEDGTATFYISPWESSNSLAEGFRNAVDSFTVPTVTLDSYCAGRAVYPDVIKIDVETYESHVLAGATQVLRRSRPAIVCEILRATDPAAIARTVGILCDHDYRLHRFSKADGWLECTADELIGMIDHHGNDWLFTPDAPVDAQFGAALERWRAAIRECTARSTVHMSPEELPSPAPVYEAPA